MLLMRALRTIQTEPTLPPALLGVGMKTSPVLGDTHGGAGVMPFLP